MYGGRNFEEIRRSVYWQWLGISCIDISSKLKRKIKDTVKSNTIEEFVISSLKEKYK